MAYPSVPTRPAHSQRPSTASVPAIQARRSGQSEAGKGVRGRVGKSLRSSKGNKAAAVKTLEIRVHGRGGQGGVTCAKLIAKLYAGQGAHVQTFGDYAAERSGAPVRAYTRVAATPITNRNKVYRPNQLLVLDPMLLNEQVLEGVAPGALLLLNSSEPLESFADRFPGLTLALVDATAIARRHQIGTRSVVIVNTTIIGAYARACGIALEEVASAYCALGLESDFPAAEAAYAATAIRFRSAASHPPATHQPTKSRPQPLLPLTEHTRDLPTELKTGSWRTQLAHYQQRLAPCNASCPAGNDVVGFIQALKTAGIEAAARILARTQPLPSVCGRVCPGFCQSGCNRNRYDGAVNVRGLERWISDHADLPLETVAPAEAGKRIAVIGSGPAGLSAAHTLARQGHRATLFEAAAELGGLLRSGIPAYRLPTAALQRDLDRILALGVEARCNQRLDRDSLFALGEEFDAVIVATGQGRLSSSACPGEDLPGVTQGLDYLAAVRAGAAPQLRGQVVVVGGGNSAIDCARTALRAGAAKVTLVYRRSREEMPAIAEEIEAALTEGVELLTHRQPVAYSGNSSVTAITLAEVEMGAPDASGRRRPVLSDRRGELPCDQVLLALGQSADLELLPAGFELRDGRIYLQEVATNLFCSGDLATGEGTVTHAIGDGRRSALRVLQALGEAVEIPLRPERSQAVPAEAIRHSHFATVAPAQELAIPKELAAISFNEVHLGLVDGGEAERCFSCGQCTRCDTCLVYCPEGIISASDAGYRVDADYCKGCGICAVECPRQAMGMQAEIGEKRACA